VKKPNFRELTEKELTQVQGGNSEVIGVPTEGCPLCTSGVDPTIRNAQYEAALLG
jgi:bacteriocin-like protein